jgi:hypothetical protein
MGRHVLLWQPRRALQEAHGAPASAHPDTESRTAPLIDAGPIKAGFQRRLLAPPVIQQCIYERCCAFYNVFSIAQLLRT